MIPTFSLQLIKKDSQETMIPKRRAGIQLSQVKGKF